VIEDYLFLIACGVGIILLTLLAMTVAGSPLRVWPLSPSWDFRSVVFWTLFRSLHVLTAAVAAVDFALWSEGISIIRVAGLVIACVSGILYLYAGVWLGKENLYGGQGGLETRGIYRYTRNPQYAAAIPACLGIGIASCSLPAFLISAFLAGVYVLMACAEEPWLEKTYGPDYRNYRTRVPRFYNWRAIWAAVQLELTRAQRSSRPG
jgi:protein-S-isoprenylcysteine O-methyltransferase Ste14